MDSYAYNYPDLHIIKKLLYQLPPLFYLPVAISAHSKARPKFGCQVYIESGDPKDRH